MPTTWVVQACSLTVDNYPGATNCLGNFSLGDRLAPLTQQAGYEWKVLHAAPGISVIPDPANPTTLTGTVRLSVVPDSIGDFELNYAGNAYGWALGVNMMGWAPGGGFSGPHPISIQPAQTAAPVVARPVPIGSLGITAVLALGLASAPFFLNRRRSAKLQKNQSR
ncbi:hypothetical protein E9531_06000 [Lampropedia puyangensis]|uniref:Uncharacterized protein n=1 Tax=Lampropedia puyangensis TaxID=1330072 RepID=A0A4S8F7Z8_9BURK|nr:hypothetical protein [Lampropedia puyangensis]THU03733.1 hypothetical protein E9531_06000 [Lampropedia puyangensis]